MWWHSSFSHNAHIPYQSDGLSPGVPIPNSLLANASGKGRRWHPSLGLCHQCVRLSWNFWLLALSWPRSGCYRHLGNEPVHGRLKESSLSLSLLPCLHYSQEFVYRVLPDCQPTAVLNKCMQHAGLCNLINLLSSVSESKILPQEIGHLFLHWPP